MTSAGASVGRVGPLRTAEHVAGALREQILAGRLVDGASLPKQDELVATFGVSYPSVREALRILETEGFITVRRGNRGGAIVHAPDVSRAGYALGLALQAMQVKVPDLGEALVILEPLCVANCARRADRHEVVLPVLERLLGESEENLRDGAAFTRSAREFHDALVSFEPNATMGVVVKSLASLWSVQEAAWADQQVSQGAYPPVAERKQAQRAHERLTECIAEGDAERAARLSAEHLEATQRRVDRTLRTRVIDAASANSWARFRR